MAKMIDSHCHLESMPDIEEVIASCKDNVEAMVTTGYDYESSLMALELAKKYEGYVYAVIGLSPQKAMRQENFERDIELVRNAKGIVAIGEIGLDFHWAKTEEERNLQRKAFDKFLDLSLELDLPAVIHSRDAEEESLQRLVDKNVKKVLMHCFGGNAELAKTAVARGYFISIPPMPSKERKRVIRSVGLEYLLVESDAPAIGRDPLSIIKSAEMISKIKGIQIDAVAGATRDNALKLFKLKG